ncbi:MAG: hypothetical protein JWN83_2137 [Chitinophagaceae bacterium]|nr:hypothetical protein [Chitinophagaceae bacterium]
MKKKLLTSGILFISLCFFSLNIFAQGAPGDSGGGDDPTGGSDGGGTIVAAQPLGVHFTRNNGDGTCGGQAQIRLYYTTAPTVAPVLTQIYYQDQPLYSNLLPITGNIADFASKGYVSFCLPTSNIPAAIKLTLTYTPGGTNQPTAEISGTD